MSAAGGGRGGVWQMLVIADEGGRGGHRVSQMLTIADDGGSDEYQM